MSTKNEAIEARPSIVEMLGVLAFSGAPALYLIAVRGVPTKVIIGYGILAWALGALVKWVIYRNVVTRLLHPRLSKGWLAAAQGLLSSLSEMGAAFFFLTVGMPRLTWLEAIGFGAGAALVEGVIISVVNTSAGTPYGQHVAEQNARMLRERPWMRPLLACGERALATVAHICSRALLHISVLGGSSLAALAALAAVGPFAGIDGVGYYALVARWPFAEPRTALKLYGLLASIVLVQLSMLIALGQSAEMTK